MLVKVLKTQKRGRGTPETSKMEFFVSFNCFFCDWTVSTEFQASLPKIVETARWQKKPLTNVTKNPIVDGAGVLQTHLGSAFLGWTLLKDKRNKVQPSVVYFQKQELNPAPAIRHRHRGVHKLHFIQSHFHWIFRK